MANRLARIAPGLRKLLSYNFAENFRHDVLARLSVAAVALPVAVTQALRHVESERSRRWHDLIVAGLAVPFRKRGYNKLVKNALPWCGVQEVGLVDHANG